MITLSATHLAKKIKHRMIVNDISLSIQQGECVGLLGPNGAGKTTCFYLMVGLLKVDQGDIHLNGQCITHTTLDERARLGLSYLPQEASIFRKMTVRDNILAILQRQPLSKNEQQTRLASLLDEFHITHLQDTLGMRLSGGERRRVEIARALALNPTFILLDEPFAGVDPISVFDIKKMITHLCQQGIGVLITDHHVRETLDICQKAYIMNQGKHLCEGSPQDILNHADVRAIYLGDDFTLD